MSQRTSGYKQWDETYTEHGVWGEIDSILDSLSEWVNKDDDSYEPLRRMLLTFKHIRGFQTVPTLMVTKGQLDVLQSRISELASHLTSWHSNRHPTHWSNVQKSFESVVSAARGWPVTDKGSLYRAAGALRVATDGLLASSKSYEQKLTELENDAKDRFEEIRSESGTHLDDANSQLSNLSNAIASLEQTLAAIKDEVSEEVSSARANFDDEVEERRVKFDEQLETQKQRLNTQMQDWADQHQVSQDQFEKTQQREIDLVRVAREKAEKVVGAIGTHSTASAYQRYADQQKLNANVLRVVAILLYVAAFGVLAWSVFVARTDEDSWKVTVIRASSTASLIAGAIYSSHESTKHRQQENVARETELKLLAMEPFIAPMLPDSQHQLRMAVAQKVFVAQMPDINEPELEDTFMEIDDEA